MPPLAAGEIDPAVTARDAAIAEYEIGDSTPEAEFDHIVALARQLFGTSAAMISVVTGDVLHFKARVGLEACALDPQIAFCSYALDRDAPLVIEDTRKHSLFCDNPLVLGDPHVRFYAGAPLKLASGDVVGTLCMIDPEPRSLTEHEQQLLQSLAQIVVDRMEVRRQERQLARLAHYDRLTRLPNRALMHQRAKEMLLTDPALAVLLFDLDGFKDVNDVFGHGTGDALLQEVSCRLTGLLEEGQLLARLGGDEFVVLAPGVADPRAAWTIAERLRTGFDRGFAVDGQDLRLDTCIGVALSPYHGSTIEKLICQADLAMYRAKEKGGGAIAFFEPHLRHKVENRQHLQHQLRGAFERGEFELFYQPQVRLADEHIIGAEALLRWRHPEHGLLSPAQFLPTLDLMPLAARVGAWALETAIEQGARWAAAGRPLRVGINLFASQFRSPALPEHLAALLAQYGLAPELVELELTEDLALKNERGVAEMLRAFRRLGVNIALDDFGTGYASLSVLRDFPITRLKVDRSFIAEIAAGSDHSAIVDSVLTLGRALNLPVIAEGIETPVQAQWLRAKGCEEAQGWWYGRPASASEIDQLLGLEMEAMPICA